MNGNARTGSRILGSLRSADGKGVVRMEDRFETDIDDLWSALTDPGRLARWLGEVEGDLRLGGDFRARFFASGWEGTGRVEACEPPRRLLVLTKEAGEPDGEAGEPDEEAGEPDGEAGEPARVADESDEHAIEATLTADGDQTILIIEERGMPLDLLAAYGAGVQVHVEDLAAHIAGRERGDAEVRWNELIPAYQDLAANIG